MCLTLTFSAAASSASLLVSNEDLAKDVELKYQALNAKTQICRESRRSQIEVDKLTSIWFADLSSDSKKVVLLIASHEAMERCTQVQADEYSLSLVEYAAQTEDKMQLEEWLKLKQNFKPEELANDIDALNSEELIASLKEPQFAKPFDLIAVIKQLNL
ncbi:MULTISPECIES: hypothetical protein [unclassified Agarivorans]|uniref:hypothetical protein n=1 Tax=unclassified Agarivorans TaxID=2636026 RepID=UPI0026E24264|nr:MULTISPECIES: hypothetical protein [unclassified Agarivorans]MDO6686737.1 hypothetical protein [Agarivorans sp. 3_MG-2023]MDO6716533.1 hypothetical protein [Agarivorans sp. 2_MG-2023]